MTRRSAALPARSNDLPSLLTDTTFEAVIFDWTGTAAPHAGADASELRARVHALCAAGVHLFVVGEANADKVRDELAAPPPGPGELHLCLDGDKSEATRWAANWLAARGITGELILVVGDEFSGDGTMVSNAGMLVGELARARTVSVGNPEPGIPPSVVAVGGGSERFLMLLDLQLMRRRQQRVPSIDADPAWVLALPEDPNRQRAAGALATLANGWAGNRGGPEEAGLEVLPLFAINGMYTDSSAPELLAGPWWDRLQIKRNNPPSGPTMQGRLLDLRTGVLARTEPSSGIRTLRFVSATRPFGLALRAEGPATRLKLGPLFARPADHDGENEDFERRLRRHGRRLARTHTSDGGGITAAGRDRHERNATRRSIDRLAAWQADGNRAPPWDAALDQLTQLEKAGFDRLLAEHREEWARRWADAEVRIEGDPEAELAARFATFHLLAAAPDEGEAAVGARGLTGRAYGGHVFWDADVFVLPALVAIRPAAARAMLEYRIRRLPAARAAAAAEGRRGARFPWESAADGTDVTPGHITGRHGEPIPVRTGEEQEHIVADVAWAAWLYATWTGDGAFLTGAGRRLLIETARYWASRIRCDEDGRGHIEHVMGPDEYHEVVDDNTYTNVMARWNLRRAAELLDAGEAAEATSWRELADAMVDGYHPQHGLYEQFAGYWDLEPLLAADVATPPFAADLLLGNARVAASQLIKQPDVIMLHHLVPDETVNSSLAADLAYYEPRTTHGSSLSPAIYAAQLARAGRPDDALELFRLAAHLDLDDITGTTAGGLHLATMGGIWQALAQGFLGLRVTETILEIDPSLPATWDALSLRFRVLGHPVGVRADHDHVTLACTEPLTVRIAGEPARRCEPPGCDVPWESSAEGSRP
jgi:trehalose/maltose hydrolase-like predicted phosphorylase